MVGTDFEVGDLVWAKMKNYPYWPSKITNPPSNTKSTPSKKAQHYVFFFGSDNCAWISDEHIVLHSEEMLQSTSTKKKTASYKAAIDKIIAEAKKVPMKKRPSVAEKHESGLQAESPISRAEKKVSKSKRGKFKHENARKQYFAAVQKTSQNQQMHKKVRKKYFMNRIKGSKSRETSSLELNGETLQGLLSSFSGRSVQSTLKEIGFLGLGKMGRRIVKTLIESGHKVTVWNRTFSKCAEFVNLSAKFAPTPKDVIVACDVTFCCVSGTDAVKAIVFGPDGVLTGLELTKEVKGYVELTTIDPVTSEEIAEAIRHKGGTYLESPITESKIDNHESLIVICAGDRELFNNCESCFYAFASDAYYLSGLVGSASNMNLLTSMFMNSVYAALAESVALVRKLNLSQDALLEFLKHGPLNHCYLLQDKGRAMTSDDFFINGTYNYQQKDLSLALHTGDSCEQPMLLTAAANQLFKHPNHLLYEPENGTSSGKSSAED